MTENPFEPPKRRPTQSHHRTWVRRWRLACLVGLVMFAACYTGMRVYHAGDAELDKQALAQRKSTIVETAELAAVSVGVSGFVMGVIGAVGWGIALGRAQRTIP